jgi:hypothetical protein
MKGEFEIQNSKFKINRLSHDSGLLETAFQGEVAHTAHHHTR